MTWNRILIFRKYTVELNLTPIGGWFQGDLETVTSETIRIHDNPRTKIDQLHYELPKIVIEEMIREIGPELTNRLVNFDYLNEIKIRTGINTVGKLKEKIPHGLKSFRELCDE